jgi:arylformamidase
LTRIVDLSPTVPEGFRGPPSTDLGVRFDVRTKPGGWQSAQAIDALPLESVIGSAVVLDLGLVSERALLDAAALSEANDRLGEVGESISPGDVVLLRTGWADRALGSPDYFRLSPALTADAAQWLVAREPRCVACDFFEEPAARDPGWDAGEFVVHRTILGAGIPLVEGVVGLGSLPPRCEFFAPFFKFGGIEAAPARAFAMVET